MRPFSYVIALVLLLAGPSLAGSADHDLPGIGTFTYNGSPIAPPAPAVMVASTSATDRSRQFAHRPTPEFPDF
jgi:hypothetical protein